VLKIHVKFGRHCLGFLLRARMRCGVRP